jgi:hypothetical protein
VRQLYQTRLTVRKLATLAGHDDAARITRAEGLKEQLARKGLKTPTINRYLSELKAPFENEKLGIAPSDGVVFRA